jgi:hypothetical protein
MSRKSPMSKNAENPNLVDIKNAAKTLISSSVPHSENISLCRISCWDFTKNALAPMDLRIRRVRIQEEALPEKSYTKIWCFFDFEWMVS